MLSSNTSQVSDDVKYIEDVCSVYLRTGTGSSQTVTTGVKENTGALVISKSRSAATDWAWYDTFRGATYDLVSNSTAAQTTQAQGLTSFNADGHTWGTLAKVNTSGATYVDTVLKPTPKFFDVVTFTAPASGSLTVNHSLTSTPGFIVIKRTDSTGDWLVYHRSTGANQYLLLNGTAAAATYASIWPNVTSTSFEVTAGVSVIANGTYVAYIFAHDAGGFGLTGTDNVISCGSFTADGSGNASVTLGYEPQWILYKSATSGGSNWGIEDSMRNGLSDTSIAQLKPNLANAEQVNAGTYIINAKATGFTSQQGNLVPSATYIYIAIRRGPMKVPTDGTKVFSANAQTTAAPTTVTTNFPVDLEWWRNGRSAARTTYSFDRLRGGTKQLRLNTTDAEQTDSAPYINYFDSNVAFRENFSGSGQDAIFWSFRRAPSFFDEVCCVATATSDQAHPHNLGVEPELIIAKDRTNAGPNWAVYSKDLGKSKYLSLNNTNAAATSTNIWGSISNTATNVYFQDTGIWAGSSGANGVLYLFATCPGVSKVGSYTGTGTTKQIDCGFAAGARFVLIKRTDSTGDWYVWDTARGIVSGNDPYLLLNTTAAEVTSTDYIDTYSAGFELSSTAPAALNASGGTYIFLAIA